jgi:histidine ammonia-lyase
VDALAYVRQVLEIEINSATDNPLVFPDGADVDADAIATGGGHVVSGGNFHGEPVAIAMDLMKTAIAELGSISERRLAQLTDPRMSGLPAFLVEDAGINSGMMLYQYVAAALVSENKSLAHPASVDSIPTSANQEDHVSMGPIAARQAAAIVANVEHALALEALAAVQGLDFRMRDGLRPGTGVAAAHALVRESVDHLDSDRDPQPDIGAALDLVCSGRLSAVLTQATTPV